MNSQTPKAMGIVRLASERRVTITMITLAVLVFGFVSVSRLKLNLLPELSYPTITIRTELPGAAPLEVENLITKPIEEAVGVIKGVRLLRSVSRTGQSDVTLEFAWGTDMDYAGVDIREKLDILTLPLEAKRPVLLRFDPSSEPVLRLGLTASKDDGTVNEDHLKALRRFADEELVKHLEVEEGVAAVKVSGGLEDEIQVLVDQQKLAQLRIPIEKVIERLRAENINLSGGRLEEGNQQFLVRTLNEFRSVHEVGDAIVTIQNGQPIRVRDVAVVRQGYREREAITRINGRETVELAIYKEGDANTVSVARAIDKRLESMRKLLPEGFELIKVYDQSTFISQAIDEVVNAAFQGGLLAALVIYLFLRNVWTTAIISVSIPVSVIASFNMMYFNDITLNIMSLGGIALAVGMLVDNSIVVLENIARRRALGEDAKSAAVYGTSEVGTAIVASTLTTVAVFLPLAFVSGIAGQLFRDQALTVTYALLFSLIIALTLIPMLAAFDKHKGDMTATPATAPQRSRLARFSTAVTVGILGIFVLLFRAIARVVQPVAAPAAAAFNRLYARLDALYIPLLQTALRHRLRTAGIAALVFIASLALVPFLGVELIPQLAQGEFYVRLKLPPGTPLERTDAAILAVQRIAANIDTIETTYSVAGTGNRLDANPIDAGENIGTLNVVMHSSAGSVDEELAMEALRRALADIPGVEYEFGRPELFTFETPLEIEITGYDLSALKQAGDAVAAALSTSARFADVKSSLEQGHPEIRIRFDQERAAQLGLVVSDVAERVVRKVRGEVATRYSWCDRKIDVLVRSLEEQRSSIEDIRKLVVNPGSDHPITLEAIADIEVGLGPAEIRRIAQERVAVVTANLRYGDLGSAVAEAQNILSRTPLPTGVTARIAGQNEEMEASFTSMQFALLLAIFLVYLVMASQFESLVHPFVILLTIPLALVGAVLALFITGTTISVVVFIGLIMLAGIVVNNGILLIDVINQRRAQGMDKYRAIVEGSHSRLRPILMTVMTTLLGLLPMALGIGEGAEIRAPMAITVIGGLLVSTLLTLVVIPAVYSLLDREPVEIPASIPSSLATERSAP